MESNLPRQFVLRMQKQLGTDEELQRFLATFERAPFKGLRVNPLKIGREEFLKISPFLLRPVPWEENGFYVTEEKIGRHPYHFAGLYYSQEPSAMSVVPLLNVQKGERVLDLCAAPGGKSTQIAAWLQGEGILVCNEINESRASVLSQNVERLGIKNAVVTNATPQRLAQKFYAWFDKILVDAPCSGEGMFKKNEKEAIENWSEENVALCASRQRDILSCAKTMLRGGGRLVYSTCTFSPEEDEEQIARFVQENPEFTLLEEKKLYPHHVEGEGHFYAVLQKSGEERGVVEEAKGNLSKKEAQTVQDFFTQNLQICPFGTLYKAGEYIYALPKGAFAFDKLPVLRAGVRLGEIIKDRFEPAHALAVCLKKDEAKRTVELHSDSVEKYLRGETVECAVENGWCLVCVDGYTLGWGKATGGVVKNHLPKGLRLVK